MYGKPSALKNTHKDIDLERGIGLKHQKPSPGWLATEKERSRSRSPDEESKSDGQQAGGGGFMKRFGFGRQ